MSVIIKDSNSPLMPDPEESAPKTDTEKRAELKQMMDALDRADRKTGTGGAVPNMPKQRLLDASDVQARHPDKRLRWVSTSNPDKLETRRAEGYERLAVAEGGRQAGTMALFAVSRQEYDRRVAAIKEMNKRRLKAHETEVEAMAEKVAKILRDEHGMRVNTEDILIKG